MKKQRKNSYFEKNAKTIVTTASDASSVKILIFGETFVTENLILSRKFSLRWPSRQYSITRINYFITTPEKENKFHVK